MRLAILFGLTLSMHLATPAPLLARHADHAHKAHEAEQVVDEAAPPASAPIVVRPHQAVVEVRGVVCSFCAYGVEKKLSKLPALDTTQFTNGVFTDIKAHRVTVALLPGQPIDLAAISRAITDAGYEPIALHLRLFGALEQHGETVLLRQSDTGQLFELRGRDTSLTQSDTATDMQVHVMAEDISGLQAETPIPAYVAPDGTP